MKRKTLFCIECGHSQRNHIILDKNGPFQMYKCQYGCEECDHKNTNWSINGNQWKTLAKNYM